MSYKLISIPASHYVERARWALDYGCVQYAEDRWPPLLHMLAVYKTGAKTTSVPVVICPDGKVLNDSQLVVKHVAETCPPAARLHPSDPEQRKEVDRLEALFAGKLGVVARVVCYQWLFDAGLQTFLAAICDQPGVPAWRRWAFKSMCLPIKLLMAAGLRINPANAAKCLARVRAIFSEVDALLADGRPFLIAGATEPTAADLSFAALGCLVMLPLVPNYGGASGLRLPQLPAHARAAAEELAATPAGQHILKLYAHHRLPKHSAAATMSDTAAKGQTQQAAEACPQGGTETAQVQAKL